MSQYTDADVAMQGSRRVQTALRAMAVHDHDTALRQVNEATNAEARWMVGQLLAHLDSMAEDLARYSRRGSTRSSVLRAAAAGMEEDVAETGAAMVIKQALHREGLA